MFAGPESGCRAEEMRLEDVGGAKPLPLARRTTLGAQGKSRSSRVDVFTGMFLSNLVMFAIITATASTLGLARLVLHSRAGRSAVVLDNAELVLLWIVHDHDDSLVVMVPLAGPAATETFDLLAGRRDVVDLDIEVDADFRDLRLRHSLERQPRPVIKA